MQGKVVPSQGMCLYLGSELSPVIWLQKQNGLLTAFLLTAAPGTAEQLHVPREGWMGSAVKDGLGQSSFFLLEKS